jgi:glutamate-1-semialdehyde 2,1-aminomutase
MQFKASAQSFEISRRYLSGGVSSGMRAAAKPVPLFFSAGVGSHLRDVDGNEFIDYALAWGPLVLGHCHPDIVAAVGSQLLRCHLLGAQNELEIQAARKICELVPSADRVVFSNTGTEAVQVALRLARASTRRRKVIRFEGHYHGWMDNIIAGYRPGTNSSPRKPGDPSAHDGDGNAETIVLPWNDVPVLEATLQNEGQKVAAIITEPVLCNTNCLLPRAGYLEALRKLATQYGIVLIFDEVITGFRVATGGAQALFGVTPDLTILGKAIAGGFPLSVVAGKYDILNLIEEQKVLHAGTFNGNPISLAAARATLDLLQESHGAAIVRMRETGEKLMAGIKQAADAAEIPILINGLGSCFHIAFTTRREMRNYRDTLDSDLAARDRFLQALLFGGIYLMPDGRWYVSAVHTNEDVTRTLEAVSQALSQHKSQLAPAHA